MGMATKMEPTGEAHQEFKPIRIGWRRKIRQFFLKRTWGEPLSKLGMDKRCEECIMHLAKDCPGEESIDGLNCWQSAEDVGDSS